MATVIEVKDITAPELDLFANLTEAQLRNKVEPEKGVFIAESPKVIHQALDAGCRPVALLMERRHLEGQGKTVMERCGDIPVYTADRSVLASLTGYELTRGILCAMHRPTQPSVERICETVTRVAVLESIVDTTNLGAIFRSAAALGMDGVLLTPNCCDPLNRRAVRVSMGTVFQLPWSRFEGTWPGEGMELLRRLGFQTAAMALSDRSVSVEDPALANAKKLAVILGTEGTGLLQSTIDSSDYTVKIPMCHGVDSLNVAAAAAVAFWQLRSK